MVQVQPLRKGVIDRHVADEPREEALALRSKVSEQRLFPEVIEVGVQGVEDGHINDGEFALDAQTHDEAVMVLAGETDEVRVAFQATRV
jgi:hypothetical protein